MSLTRRKLFGIVVGGLAAPFLPKPKLLEPIKVGRDWVVKHSYTTSIAGAIRPDPLQKWRGQIRIPVEMLLPADDPIYREIPL